MIPSAFLMAALSLHPDPLADYRMLIQFIHAYIPNCEIVLVHDEELPKRLGYEQIPFRFHDCAVYVRKIKEAV